MEIFNGGIAVDDRGSVSFVNDFDFKGVKRFYMVQNHEKGFVRAWHGHKKESKYILVTRGTIRLILVNMETEIQEEYILSDKKPQILFIPAGYYNGFQTLADDTQVMFFSTTTLEESKDDDYREKWNKFNEWEKNYR